MNKRTSEVVRRLTLGIVASIAILNTISPVVGQTSVVPQSLSEPWPTKRYIGNKTALPNSPLIQKIYYTAPSDLPIVQVTTPATNTAEGNIFFSTFLAAGMPYLMIVDNEGEPIYYQRFDNTNIVLADFKKQFNGNLTYFEGFGSYHGANGRYIELDNTYQKTRTWVAGDAASADIHDLQLLANGNALVTYYKRYPLDLSSIGGYTTTDFYDSLVHEVRPNGLLAWEWSTAAHIPISDTYIPITPTVTRLDFAHINAIEVDHDNNLLVSNRHLSEISKVNRQTGEIIWRLGGKENQFTFTNDGGFSFQHDIRRLPNGNITLFDNGNLLVPPISRAVEYEIDETNKVITKVWEYRQTPDIFQSFMGNAQRLSNGNTFIGWGGPRALISEIGADGTKKLELEINTSTYGYLYRAFRFPWEGNPTTTPTLVLTNSALYMSWNGATGIQSWDVDYSRYPDQFTQTTNITRTGFESSISLANLAADACYFRVKPQRSNNITRYSDVIALNGPSCGPQLQISRVPADQLVLSGANAAFTVTLSNIGAVALQNINVQGAGESGNVNECDLQLTHLDAGRTMAYRCTVPGLTQSGLFTLTANGSSLGNNPQVVTATAGNAITVYDAAPTLSLSNDTLNASWPLVNDVSGWVLEYSRVPNVFTQSITVSAGLTQTLIPLADVPPDACFFRAQAQHNNTGSPYSNIAIRSDGSCGAGLQLTRTPKQQVTLRYGAAAYTVTLTNSGALPLQNIATSGSLPGCNLSLKRLDAGEAITYQCAVNRITDSITHTLTAEAEIDASAFSRDTSQSSIGTISVSDLAQIQTILYFYPIVFSR